MTKLFGCICNEPHRLVQALAPIREVLVAPGPHHGWGVGYVQSGEVLLRHNPKRNTGPVDFFAALDGRPADYVVGHADYEGAYTGNENTQPFRFRQWMFAQQGGIASFADVRPALLEHVPAFLSRQIKGKTSAEHVFHLFLAFLHDAGALDDPNLPLLSSRSALRDTLALTYSLATKAGAGSGPGNVIVTNSRSMLAVRVSAPLHIRRFNGIDPSARRDLFKAVLVVSDAAEVPEGFEEVPDKHVLMISRDLTTEIVPLDG